MIKKWISSLKSKYIYEVPYALTGKEWNEWRKDTASQYPVQFFVREHTEDFLSAIKYRYRDVKYTVVSWFRPCHPIVRKAIPRKWSDLSGLVIDVNLAIILQFKEEADAGIVDWEWNETHKEFKAWLDDAADWVKVRRPALQAEQDKAYPPLGVAEDNLFGDEAVKIPYEELYGEVDRLRRLIDETDTKYIKELIDKREFFWT